jgi:hypothetical protein
MSKNQCKNNSLIKERSKFIKTLSFVDYNLNFQEIVGFLSKTLQFGLVCEIQQSSALLTFHFILHNVF